MPSRRAVLAGGIAFVGIYGIANWLGSCSGSVPDPDSIEKGDAVTVGGEVRRVARDGTSLRVVSGTTAIVELPPTERDEAKDLSKGSCVNGVEGIVRGIDNEEEIIFIKNGEV